MLTNGFVPITDFKSVINMISLERRSYVLLYATAHYPRCSAAIVALRISWLCHAIDDHNA